MSAQDVSVNPRILVNRWLQAGSEVKEYALKQPTQTNVRTVMTAVLGECKIVDGQPKTIGDMLRAESPSTEVFSENFVQLVAVILDLLCYYPELTTEISVELNKVKQLASMNHISLEEKLQVQGRRL